MHLPGRVSVRSALTAPEAVFSGIALTSGNVVAGVLAGRSSPTPRSAGLRPAFRLTPHDRRPGFGEARTAAFDMGGNLVAELAVGTPIRVVYAQLRADPSSGRRPDLHVMPMSGWSSRLP
jgi:hypothetical protein